MTRTMAVVGMFLAMALAGCASRESQLQKAFSTEGRWILEAPESMEFFTLKPSYEGLAVPPPGTMHGHTILGQTMIVDAALRRQLVEALVDAVTRDNDLASGCVFSPRHALRLTRGGKVADVLICFECRDLQTHLAGKIVGTTTINASSQALFERVARDAGLVAATRPSR